jgi:glutamine phosphoribosylpyrophosphate amidotransferase
MNSDYFILGYYFDALVRTNDGKEYTMIVIAENLEKASCLMEKYIARPDTVICIKKILRQQIVIDKNFVK